MKRQETRKQRYEAKSVNATRLPLACCTVNFDFESNVGFLARALGCFGGHTLHIIGKMPSYDALRRYSGGMSNFIDIKNYSHPFDFIKYVRESGSYLISAELTDTAVDLYDFKYPMDKEVIIATGHETNGICNDLLNVSDAIVKIPLLGAGACLNTSMTANVFAYEYQRQYLRYQTNGFP